MANAKRQRLPSGLTVEPGRAVQLSYRLTLQGGLSIDAPREPVWFIHGSASVPAVLQKHVLGKQAGFTTELTLSPAEAFGNRNPALVLKIARDKFKASEPLVKGKWVQATRGEKTVTGCVTQVTPQVVEVDFNHRYAGYPVTASLTIIAVAEKIPAA